MALETMLQSRRSPELHRQLVEHYAAQRRRAIEAMAATPRAANCRPRFLEVAASYMIAVADGMQIQALIDPEVGPTADELAVFYESRADRRASRRAASHRGAIHAGGGMHHAQQTRVIVAALVGCACLIGTALAFASETFTTKHHFTPDKLGAPANLSASTVFA